MNYELFIRSGSQEVDFALLKDGRLIELHKEEEENNFFNILVEEESNRLLFNAINTLAPQSAAIIQLSLQGLKNEEIARELSISENTVKVLKYIYFPL